ncbi:FecCD family ABC transporter permease [Staphylococcus debuckii]|uniref:FecCD family ABC transporter permease n=1 Tax=Staphylococcus debuckii TaxID=2044912 RepID=UPI000F437788|nr:iron ABC transporter permease [Staphylococcus debuckii]AYU56242.1 iron ABC transporter permease [Staphylococcus debuckii]
MKQTKIIVSWSIVLIASIALSLFWHLGSWSNPLNNSILFEVRMPRMSEALLAGIGLSIAGQMFQTVLNNPLADSLTLGLASGSVLGAGMAVFIGLSSLFIPLASMVASIVTLVIVLVLTSVMSKGYPMRALILSGIMIGALFNAFLYLLILLDERRLKNIVMYMFGGFSAAEMREVAVITPVLVVCLVLLILLLPQIKLLQVGTLKAQSLSINVPVLMYSVLAIASIMTAVIISYTGIIGFIGMIVPQLIRRTYRVKLGGQMLLNGMIGGAVMVLADSLGAQLIAPTEIPASIILALLGIPVLGYLIATQPR